MFYVLLWDQSQFIKTHFILLLQYVFYEHFLKHEFQ